MSAHVLGLVDHETYREDGGDARGARRSISRGRSILSALGAWPWTHAPVGPGGDHEVHRGVLPDGWWALDEYAAALRDYLGALP